MVKKEVVPRSLVLVPCRTGFLLQTVARKAKTKVITEVKPTAPPKKVYCRVLSYDAEAVRDFIAGLNGALANARYSGGSYSAFLPFSDGVHVLQVEVKIPWDRPKVVDGVVVKQRAPRRTRRRSRR